jgi:outer membrane protein OmpA-like peptidoglycan-associated protein
MGRQKHWIIALFLLASGIPVPAVASTANFSSFDLWPAPGDPNYFVIPSTEGLYKFQYSIGLSNVFLYRPLEVRTTSGGRLRSSVDISLGHFLSVAYGLTDRWQLAASIPYFSYARFESPTTTTSTGLATVRVLGDLRITSKYRLLDLAKHRWGLAFRPFVTIPLGAKTKYLGDNKVAGGGQFITDFLITPRIMTSLSVGGEVHERVLVNNIDFQHRLLSTLGLSAMLGKKITASIESSVHTALKKFFSDKDSTPVEVMGGAQYKVGKSGLILGAGAGSCIICGAKGAKIRGVVEAKYLDSRAQHIAHRKRDVAMRHITLGVEVPKDQYTEVLLHYELNCPNDPEQYDSTQHDAACPKYYDLVQRIKLVGGDPEQAFAVVILDLKEKCPANPEDYRADRDDPACPKFFDLRHQAIEESIVTLDEDQRFAMAFVEVQSICPQNPDDFDALTHDQSCEKYFDLRQNIVVLARDLERVKMSEIDLAMTGLQCPDSEDAFDGTVHDDGCDKVFVLRNELSVLQTRNDVEVFNEWVLASREQCPMDEENYSPDVDSASCESFYELRHVTVESAPMTWVLASAQQKDEDKDGIPDLFDSCPTEAEDKNGVADQDGCPESGIQFTRDEIWTSSPIEFGFNRISLSSSGYEVIRNLSEALYRHPEIKGIEIIGHTDNIGSDSINEKVSRRRAETVIQQLIYRGVPNWIKLTALAQGEKHPIAPNTSARGRQRNRRVIFKIVSDSE